MDDRDVETMSDSEALSDLDVTRAKIAVLESREIKILDRLEQNRYAKTLGAHDLPRLLAHRYRLDLADTTRRVKLAVDLRKYPAVAAALPTPGNVIPDAGVVLNLPQARAIMSALEQIPKSANVPVEELDAAAEQMVEAARHMKPNELQSMGVQVRNILDTDGPEPREDAARQREEVWVTKVEDGVKFGGYLAGENAEKLQTVLQTGAKPHKTEDGEMDPRSRGKRQADALIDALDISLASGDLPTRGGIKPHITVTINLDDLLDAGRQATGDLTYGDGLSASAIRRLACDGGIIPVVLGSDSQPLDVGREKRYVTDGLRNALNQRDRGCVVCHAPPIYCDAHHLVSWADGGVTSLTNLVLLCRVDHTSLHDGHWTITIVNNQVQVTRPTWADPPRPDTERRLNQPSTTSATAPATTATGPCSSPATTVPDSWPAPTATGGPPAASKRTSPGADPWPSEATVEGPTSADADPCSPPATTAAEPWSAPTATGGPPAAPKHASPGADPWPSEATVEGPASADAAPCSPPATTAADPWSAPAAADTDHAVADGSSGTKSATTSGPPAGPAPASGPAQAPRLNWPYSDDAAWITAEEANALDPWGDNSAGADVPAMPEPVSESTGSQPCAGDAPWVTSEEAAALDPWGENPAGAAIARAGLGAKPAPTSGRVRTEDDSWATPDRTAGFDPWADSA